MSEFFQSTKGVILRWIFLLPAVVLGALIANLMFHVAYVFLGAEDNLLAIGVRAIMVMYLSVYTGLLVAPKRKVGFIVLCICFSFLFLGAIYAISIDKIAFDSKFIVSGICMLIGFMAGWQRHNEDFA